MLVPYPLLEGPSGEIRIQVAGQVMPLSQVSAMILGELKLDAKTTGSILAIAASGAGAGKVGIAGSVTVNDLDNVTDAHFSVAGVPDTKLNWGSHGATGNKVWFWANAWQIPKDYPLGDTTVRVTFTTVAGKVGTFDHLITIIP